MKSKDTRWLLAACSAATFVGFSVTTGAWALSAQPSAPWGLSGCQVAIAMVPISKDAIRPYLPQGYALQPVIPPELKDKMPDPRAEALFAVEAFKCDHGVRFNNDPLGQVDWGSLFTFVEPPEDGSELQKALNEPSDRRFYMVKLTPLVNSPDLEYLTDRGVAAVDGSVTFNHWFQAPGGPEPGLPELSLQKPSPAEPEVAIKLQSDDYRITGTTGLPVDTYMDPTGDILTEPRKSKGVNGTFAAYTPALNGMAVWRADWQEGRAYGGAGWLQMSAGSLGAKIVGDTAAANTGEIAGKPPAKEDGGIVAQVYVFTGAEANYSAGSFTLLNSGTGPFEGANLPAVAAITPASGPVSGGTQVVVSGARLDGVDLVRFGGTDVSERCDGRTGSGAQPCFSVQSADRILVYSPARELPALEHISVRTPAGVSPATDNDLFQYLAEPLPAREPGGAVSGGLVAGPSGPATPPATGGPATSSGSGLSNSALSVRTPVSGGTAPAPVSRPAPFSVHLQAAQPVPITVPAAQGPPERAESPAVSGGTQTFHMVRTDNLAAAVLMFSGVFILTPACFLRIRLKPQPASDQVAVQPAWG